MEFLKPEEVLKKLHLKNNWKAADFGCGSGGWVIPLAKILSKGKVYAIDILDEPLSALRSKLRTEKLFNVDVLKANVEKKTTLLSESCDLVLMTNLLFQVENKKSVFEEAKRVLKSGGKILVVDWKEEVDFGPEKKVSLIEIKNIAKGCGFILENEFEGGVYHFCLLFTKP